VEAMDSSSVRWDDIWGAMDIALTGKAATRTSFREGRAWHKKPPPEIRRRLRKFG
jgi:hypothetical protein